VEKEEKESILAVPILLPMNNAFSEFNLVRHFLTKALIYDINFMKDNLSRFQL
jgi:hypothetical protein